MEKPLRVLHVVVNMNRGGAETLIMNLYRNIDRSKVQFDFLTCKEGVFDTEIEKMGGVIHRIPYVSEVGHLGYIKALNVFFGIHSEYKIVHSHMDKMSGFVLRAAKKAGVPNRIAHSHSTKSEGGKLTRLYKWYAGHFILLNATNLIGCSDKASFWLYGKHATKALKLKNGIDLEEFSFSFETRKKIREELDINEKSLVIGHVGRFSHPKNHTFLIDVFNEFQKKHSDCILVLCGDGPLRPIIEQKTRDLKLANKVYFLGTRDDINKVLQAFDIFLFPSLYEGLPVSIIEAQAIGLTCFVSDRVTKEIDLGTGLVHYVNLGNPQEWVEKLSLLKKFQLEPNSHSIIKQKGYDILKTAKDLESFYNKLI